MNVLYRCYRKCREILNDVCRQKENEHYFKEKALEISQLNADCPKEWLLFTVAFNTPELIKYQHLSLKGRKNIKYLVMDNSSNETARETIADYCKEQGIGYISLPLNEETNSSYSHAMALNWTIRNVVLNLLEKSSIKYWGILDHDIFNVSDSEEWFLKTADILKSRKVYGLKQDRDEKWYFWPGFVFFEREWTMQNRSKFDMGITSWGDTGSRMYGVYKCLKGNNDIFAEQVKRCINNHSLAGAQENEYEIFDNEWLHTIGGSGWAGNDANAKIGKLLKMYGEKIYG